MTEEERQEDEALKKCIQEAYGCSDEQLLAELDELEATISDSDFPGAEDRIYQKLLARAAEEESSKQAENGPLNSTEPASGDIPPAAPVPLPGEIGEKRARFGKKKVFLVAVLAAAFVAMLGVTAIGGKNYFFKIKKGEQSIVFSNSKEIKGAGKLDEAYEIAEDYLNMPIMRFGYLPADFNFKEVILEEGRATFFFEYENEVIHFIQEMGNMETSLGIYSDRKNAEEEICVYNEWLKKNIYIDKEILESGKDGYSALVRMEDRIYRMVGQMDEEEFVRIVKNLNFY